MTTVKAVIFHHKSLLGTVDGNVVTQVRRLLEKLQSHGLKIAIHSTHRFDIENRLTQHQLPRPDLFLTRNDVCKPKGSPEWVNETARRLSIQNHELIYVGEDKYSWLSAIHSACIYFHSGWSVPRPSDVTAINLTNPDHLWKFLTHFFLIPPRFEYWLDSKNSQFHIRVLLNKNVKLVSTTPSPSFDLNDVFTYGKEIKVGQTLAQNILLLHAISSLYLEGLIKPNARIVIYPGSSPGKHNPVIQSFIEPISKIFHGYYRDNLIVRTTQAADTSLERYNKRNVDYTHQTNTVCLNQKEVYGLNDNQVIVVDDFMTDGKSLDWARNLFQQAGVQNLILMAIGRYPKDKGVYEYYAPTKPAEINPFETKKYNLKTDFKLTRVDMKQDPSLKEKIKSSFEAWSQDRPLFE